MLLPIRNFHLQISYSGHTEKYSFTDIVEEERLPSTLRANGPSLFSTRQQLRQEPPIKPFLFGCARRRAEPWWWPLYILPTYLASTATTHMAAAFLAFAHLKKKKNRSRETPFLCVKTSLYYRLQRLVLAVLLMGYGPSLLYQYFFWKAACGRNRTRRLRRLLLLLDCQTGSRSTFCVSRSTRFGARTHAGIFGLIYIYYIYIILIFRIIQ